jgi:hypothetical protein
MFGTIMLRTFRNIACDITTDDVLPILVICELLQRSQADMVIVIRMDDISCEVMRDQNSIQGPICDTDFWTIITREEIDLRQAWRYKKLQI